MAFAGMSAGSVFEGEKRFDLVVRLQDEFRNNLETISNLYLPLPNGSQIPLREVAMISYQTGPAQISRDDTKRRIVVSVNVRNRDVETLVEEIQQLVNENVDLPVGYHITYGGQFENLENAKRRLMVAVPVALLLIFILLYFTFNSLKQAALVYTAIPLAAIGGVFSLWIRDMPFSISAGVGFIALFGIAVLNGIVLISFFNELKHVDGVKNIRERVLIGTKQRLRPVVLTAATDVLGFFPMAFSVSAGAEVQRPLATVVIGGLISSTLLTLIVLPVIYYIFDEKGEKPKSKNVPVPVATAILLFLLFPLTGMAQQEPVNLEQSLQIARKNNAALKANALVVDQEEVLKNTGFDPGKTMIFYQTEENSLELPNDGINSIGIQQSLEFPTVYTSQTRANRKSMEMSQWNYRQELLDLNRMVSQAYYQMVYQKNKISFLNQLDSIYLEMAQASRRRFETGETNLLEKLSAEARQKELNYQLEQASADLVSAEIRFNGLLQAGNRYTSTEESLQKVIPEDRLELETHPGIQYFNSLQEFNQAQLAVSRNKMLPGIYGQYFRQTVNGESGFMGYQLGLNLPIWFIPQTSRIQAAKIEKDIALNRHHDYRMRLQAHQNVLLSSREKYLQALEYYENQALDLSETLISTASRSFREGETSYLEFNQALEQAFRIRLGYLDALNQYNQNQIELQYLNLE
jgi:cobalt-zinc-cadmium resistance protein CzcA